VNRQESRPRTVSVSLHTRVQEPEGPAAPEGVPDTKRSTRTVCPFWSNRDPAFITGESTSPHRSRQGNYFLEGVSLTRISTPPHPSTARGLSRLRGIGEVQKKKICADVDLSCSRFQDRVAHLPTRSRLEREDGHGVVSNPRVPGQATTSANLLQIE